MSAQYSTSLKGTILFYSFFFAGGREFQDGRCGPMSRCKNLTIGIGIGPRNILENWSCSAICNLFNWSILFSNLQLHVHMLPLHLGPCIPCLWTENDSTGRHGSFSQTKTQIDISTVLMLRWICPTLRRGAPTWAGLWGTRSLWGKSQGSGMPENARSGAR